MVEIEKREETIVKSKEPVLMGGMGAGVTDYILCREAAKAGERTGHPIIPMVSGTGLPAIMIDRLQGDYSDVERIDTIRALKMFDLKFSLNIGQTIIDKYQPKTAGEKHELAPKADILVLGDEAQKAEMTELAVVAAFAEVYLAKEGHNGKIGINVLEKIQSMHTATTLGAMMAGVDYVEAGAGVPKQFPKMFKNFAEDMPAEYLVDVDKGEKHKMSLDPKRFTKFAKEKLKIPEFLIKVSHHLLAQRLANTIEEGIDGFIITGDTPGHRANSRDKVNPVINGQSNYTDEKNKADLSIIKNLKDLLHRTIPFYLAGGYSTKLKEAQREGAVGVEIGSLFALCNESGMREDLKEQIRQIIVNASGEDLDKFIQLSPIVSPTGFTFTIALVDGTLSQTEIYEERHRSCKYGYLVEFYKTPEGIGSRCPAEQVGKYMEKGGKEEDTIGKRCLCEGLIATVGHNNDPAIVTLGDLRSIKKIMQGKAGGRYSAEDVLRFTYSQ
jgi:nitronate monooxygenase